MPNWWLSHLYYKENGDIVINENITLYSYDRIKCNDLPVTKHNNVQRHSLSKQDNRHKSVPLVTQQTKKKNISRHHVNFFPNTYTQQTPIEYHIAMTS